MSRMVALVEGSTEQAVIDRVIAPHLGLLGVYVYPRIIGKPGHKGGTRRKFESVLKEIRALFRQERESVVTTFFDYYGLPLDWPGVQESKGCSPAQIPQVVENAIGNCVAGQLGNSFNPIRFVPYIQMYELEALLFSGPNEMAEEFRRPTLVQQFRQIVKECGGCELINDDPETAPSKRIELNHSAYRKGRSDLAHAPLIALHIGLERIRAACPHFNEWISRLELLSQPVE